jgi:hypothetical protein
MDRLPKGVPMRYLVAVVVVLSVARSALGGGPEPRILVCGWGSSNVVAYGDGDGAVNVDGTVNVDDLVTVVVGWS